MDRVIFRAAALSLAVLAATGCAGALAATDDAAAKPDSGTAAQAAPAFTLDVDSEVRKAQLLRNAGDLTGASKLLSQLMLVAPDDPRVVGEYGKLLTQRGQSADAVAFLKRAIELNPGDWMIYSALGVAYDQMNDRAHARLAYDQALRLKPGEAAVLNNYGMSRMLAGDLAGAEAMFAQAKAAGGDTRVDENIARVADMRLKRGEKPATAIASARLQPPRLANATPSAVRSSTPLASSPTVMMQAVPYDAKAGPVGPARRNSEPVATAAPRALAAHAPPAQMPDTIMMQRVPFDPLAGPVKTASAKPLRKVAKAPAKDIAAQTAEVRSPQLRTAADTH